MTSTSMAFASCVALRPTLRRSPLSPRRPARIAPPNAAKRCRWVACLPVEDAEALVRGRQPSQSSPEPMSSTRMMRSHTLATVGWIGVALATAVLLGYTRGSQLALEFITAYVIEYSLSIDNLFVFLLIFGYFNVPERAQRRVLTWGIVGAMVLRGIMIFAGVQLTRRFELVVLAFASLLLFSTFRLLFDGSDSDAGAQCNMANNGIVNFARSLVQVSDTFDGDRFFTVRNGVRMATPLFLVLLCVELSDVVFALDSVPAVLGISEDTAVIYLSNILAIQGLRSLFFILARSIGGLRFLSKSLAVVLGFVGLKMIVGVFGLVIPILPSLIVILGTLGAGVGLSLAFPEPDKAI